MGAGIAILVDGTLDTRLSGVKTAEVYERIGEPTRYRLEYPTDIAESDLPDLVDEATGPGSLLSVLVLVEDGAECLAHGPVRGQSVSVAHGGEGSVLEVIGADRLIELDREARSRVWTDVADSDVVATIVSSYGFEAEIEPTPGLHTEAKNSLVQRETDLRFVQRLARRNGFLFWLTCDEEGTATAHFKRPPLDDEPAAELVINEKNRTMDSFKIEWDIERPTSVDAQQLDAHAKVDVDGGSPISPQSPLGNVPLAQISPEKRTLLLTAPVDDLGDLRSRADGALIESEWFLKGRCTTDYESVCAVVRAHTVIDVRGVGSRHAGYYFVGAVRHLIDAVAHRMEIELLRNAWSA